MMYRSLSNLKVVLHLYTRRSPFSRIPQVTPFEKEISQRAGDSSFHSLAGRLSLGGYEFHHTDRAATGRLLSSEAASHDQVPSERKARRPATQKQEDHEGLVRQSYSASKRYTSREIENKDDVQEWKGEDEADTFGTLSDGNFFKESDTSLSSLSLEVEEDGRDWKRERQTRHTAHWYASRMMKLVKKGKLAEAINFLEERMLKLDHVKPIEYNYDVLIGACGRAGYTKKAFQLYNKMKERGLFPSNVTYTSLFNACAESPWPLEDGNQRLKKLHQQLKDKDIKVSLVTSHAMIKAYGKCGDIEGAFHLFHHLLSTGHVVTRSFASVLTACASHKEAGFIYAIEAWRQMRARGLQPDIYCYNLLLRVMRDCGIGDQETASKTLLKPVTVDDSQLLTAGRGKKGKRGRRTKTDLDAGKKNVEDMVQLPAVLVGDDEKILSTEEDGQMDGNLSGLEHPGGSGGQSLSEENTARRDSLFDDGWYDPEESVDPEWESSGGTSAEHDDINETKHWWEHGRKNNGSGTLTVQGRGIVMGSRIKNKDVALSLPNLLDHDANFENVQSLASIQTPFDRLSLIGGVKGLLQKMKETGAKPDIKTLSLLTDLIPQRIKDENRLLATAEDLGVSLDVDFYNMIIHRRSCRGDLERAKEIVSLMNEKGLRPNLRTFANLAISCRKMEDGLQLLEDVKNSGLQPNQVIYGALMSAACWAKNYAYLVRLMSHMTETGVKPNRQIIERLEEVASPDTSFKLKPTLQAHINGFRGSYYKWLAATEAVAEPHPWDGFTLKRKEDEEKKQHTS